MVTHAKQFAVVVVGIVRFDDFVGEDMLSGNMGFIEVDQIEASAVIPRAQTVEHVRWVFLLVEILSSAFQVESLDDLHFPVLIDRAIELDHVDAVLPAIKQPVDAAFLRIVKLQTFRRQILFVVKSLVVDLDVAIVGHGDAVDILVT